MRLGMPTPCTSPEPFETSTAFRREIGGIKIKFSCPIRFPIGQTLAMTDKQKRFSSMSEENRFLVNSVLGFWFGVRFRFHAFQYCLIAARAVP